ncbi:putative beta-lactamase [Actinoplanes missouriensis 431]|uniref:Putative beta-lactamase n=1 Tax=Actinoplanes missouriensis (strain ATCC 14538 / DSM 43046 / CBS 188.64 / JCM 3121 / NBRC 102363 / NCIMB 12654 / NRRL B-3342 / UNCC 431) TaxID=512565 RepID=I0H7Z9_ACTM4|nr:serine hydrolase domain-containing protein [Actinoplanes missouriensis]BAL89136.1 putative beta-lactamase [Actinoplanes missouriensis 431]
MAVSVSVPMSRRGALGVAATALLAGCAKPSSEARAIPNISEIPEVPQSFSVVPAFDPAPLKNVLTKYLKPTKANPRHPTYAGAVAVVLRDGRVAAKIAVGHALRYQAGPVELPAAKRVAMRTDSIFDLASLTKVYTAILLLQQVERGAVDLDTPVVRYLPAFTGKGKNTITVRMLLTHTSGLPVGANVKNVLGTPLLAGAVPGTTFRYSSTGLMVAAEIVEKVTGKNLAVALKTGVTGPLGLTTTGFTPLKWLSKADQAKRLVATDARSSRGLLRGIVHDDVAAKLGGVIGSAGVFGTAHEVAVIGQLLLGGGVYNGKRILAAATVKQMLTNQNKGKPAIDPERPGRPSDHGLGVTLRQPWFMGRLSSAATFGHTGFTGTSLLVHPGHKLVLALLTNRAHPNWSWADPDPMRAEVANAVAAQL